MHQRVRFTPGSRHSDAQERVGLKKRALGVRFAPESGHSEAQERVGPKKRTLLTLFGTRPGATALAGSTPYRSTCCYISVEREVAFAVTVDLSVWNNHRFFSDWKATAIVKNPVPKPSQPGFLSLSDSVIRIL